MSRSLRRARAVIDANLVPRLEALAEAAVARFPEVSDPLVTKLASAKLVSAARLPADVITIGSDVTYRDEVIGRAQRVILAWPEHADISRGIVSILTPVGVALLGLSSGDRFRWTTRAGERRALTVLEVAPMSAEAPKT
ncbi:MAG: nucleoside diphosphate kinase regulator [Pararhodobacter sp.]|nr:nucleoside diphosphate kinase regulator [Pararhodobacter sp.]